MAGGGGRRRRLVQYLMVLEVRRRPLNLGQPVRALHQLDHERDVGDGEAQGLDAGEPLLVGKGGNLRGRQTTWRVSHGRKAICNLDYPTRSSLTISQLQLASQYTPALS